MCIEIKYEKFVSETGEPMVRINKIKALSVGRLPENYLSGYPSVYFKKRLTGTMNNKKTVDCLRVKWRDLAGNEWEQFVEVGQDLDTTEFKKLMKRVKKAGKRLMKINKKNRKKAKKGWQGQEALKI